MVLTQYIQLFCAVVQNRKLWSNISLQAILFLKLSATNVAISEKPSSCFILTNCVRYRAIFRQKLFIHFKDADYLPYFSINGILTGIMLIQ